MARTDEEPLPGGTADLGTPLAGEAVDLTAAPEAAVPLVPPEVVAQTLADYVRAQWLRIKGGDAGMLPVIVGLAIIVVVFEFISPRHVFLSAGNIVNLFQQSTIFMVLGIAEIFVLLLGEIDLSLGYWGAVGGVIAVQLVEPKTANWPWVPAIIVALAAVGVVGAVQGTIITRLRIPSFVVTLGGLLIGNGVMLIVLGFGPYSGYPSLNGTSPNLHALHDLMWSTVSPLVGWVVMAVIVGLMGIRLVVRDTSRRRSGLVAPPVSLTYIKIALMAAVGAGVVAICNVNRAAIGTLEGVPYVIFIVFGVLVLSSFLLQRTRYGRYVYAIGGNPEAARRAGINVAMVRTWGFVLSLVAGGIGGILYASYIGGMSNNFNGGQYVLYAVAAAVIGGTSLFGGRGKASHGVLGGLVIGGIYNGMYLLGLVVQWQFIVTGFVLLSAVMIDSLSRRAGAAGAAGR